MTRGPIPAEIQIRALLTGTLGETLKEYGEFAILSAGQYITISKSYALDFLQSHPILTNKYLERVQGNRGTHDVFTIIDANGGYEVAWMDHGEPRSAKFHATKEEAIIDYMGALLHLRWNETID